MFKGHVTFLDDFKYNYPNYNNNIILGKNSLSK